MRSLFVVGLVLLLQACGSPRTEPGVIPYPLNSCIVMDSELGSMGNPIVRVYNGREIKFCCQPCVEEFEADPEFFLDRLDSMIAASKD